MPHVLDFIPEDDDIENKIEREFSASTAAEIHLAAADLMTVFWERDLIEPDEVSAALDLMTVKIRERIERDLETPTFGQN